MKNSNKKAVLILGLIVVVNYFPVTILGHTYNPSLNHEQFPIMDFGKDYGCHVNCTGPYYNTIDPAADGDQTWPLLGLAAKLYNEGIIPLWNPYLAAGTPLAADSANYAFTPLMIFYVLPNSFWDIGLLVSVWAAGVFTYFLLRSWNLQFLSSLLGGTIFMLSGAFSWYLTHNSILVIMFSPLILLSIEKVIQDKSHKYMIIGSLAFASSILGAHLESIVLMTLLSFTYSVFRILHMVKSKENTKYITVSAKEPVLINIRKGTIFRISLIFIFGLGLSSFFVLPAIEYLLAGGIVSNQQVGPNAIPYFSALTNLVPYALGSSLHNYMIPSTSAGNSWDYVGGYIPSSCLILSLIGIVYSNNSGNSIWQKRTAQFFFCISIFFILKSIGIPIINLVGTLPVLEHIIFPRYDGFIWTLGFAITAAFGIEVISTRKIPTRNLTILATISYSVIIVLASFYISDLKWGDLGSSYFIFEVLQSLFFSLVSFLLIISYQKERYALSRIFLLVVLELSLYIPFSLSPLWAIFRSFAVISGAIVLCLFAFLPIKQSNDSITKNCLKFKIFFTIISITLIAQTIVYVESPVGLKIKTDEFNNTPVTEFLANNVDHFRIYSFDYAFVPNYPAVYKISTLGIMSAQNVKWYNDFYHNFIDPYSISTNLDYYGNWRQPNAPELVDVYTKNKNYFDFLGVKYLISHQSNPNQLQNPTKGDKWYPLSVINGSITQTFVSRLDNITNISIQLGTGGITNPGEVILIIDSIPYDQKYHRASILKAPEVVNDEFNFFKFETLEKTKGKKLSISLTYTKASQNNIIAVGVHDMNSTVQQDNSSNTLTELFTVNGIPLEGSMVFDIFSFGKFPLAFHYGDFNIFENKDTFPRSFFVNKFKVTDSYENAQKIISNSKFNFKKEIVLEKPLPKEEADLINSSNDNDSYAKILSYSANEVNIQTSSKSPSILILTDTFYPGWKAYVNGTETTIYRADGLVRAIFVPTGEHDIEFSYMPQSFVFGTYLSLGTAIVLTIFYVLPKIRHKENNKKD
jgi:hypothetical protein